MTQLNNNETYKLLELSEGSESDLELPELILTPKKKRVKRKLRKHHSSSSVNHSNPANFCNIRTVTIWIAAILLTTWIVTLTWLAIVLHNEIERLDSAVREVVASSQGVPDTLQRCHTISKSLQQNQTLISSQISTLKLQLENFTKDVSDMQLGLSKIQEKLQNVPEYVNVPQQFKDVSSSIANLGSQIKDLTTTVAILKSSKEQLETTNNALVQNVTNLRQSVNTLQNSSQVPAATVNSEHNEEMEKMMNVIDGIKNNITTINSTLSSNIIWIKEDLKKNNKNIEGISNVGQNMSARVTTLEGICRKTSSEQITLSTSFKNVSDEFKAMSTNVQNQASLLGDLKSKIYKLSQNNSLLTSQINILNQSLDDTKSYTQAQDVMHERNLNPPSSNLNSLRSNESPSSTAQQASLEPTSASIPAKEESQTGKPSILSSP